ncbi:MAG: hypothetical protein V4664_02800 [Patescibacteria group bacterium]
MLKLLVSTQVLVREPNSPLPSYLLPADIALSTSEEVRRFLRKETWVGKWGREYRAKEALEREFGEQEFFIRSKDGTVDIDGKVTDKPFNLVAVSPTHGVDFLVWGEEAYI